MVKKPRKPLILLSSLIMLGSVVPALPTYADDIENRGEWSVVELLERAPSLYQDFFDACADNEEPWSCYGNYFTFHVWDGTMNSTYLHLRVMRFLVTSIDPVTGQFKYIYFDDDITRKIAGNYTPEPVLKYYIGFSKTQDESFYSYTTEQLANGEMPDAHTLSYGFSEEVSLMPYGQIVEVTPSVAPAPGVEYNTFNQIVTRLNRAGELEDVVHWQVSLGDCLMNGIQEGMECRAMVDTRGNVNYKAFIGTEEIPGPVDEDFPTLHPQTEEPDDPNPENPNPENPDGPNPENPENPDPENPNNPDNPDPEDPENSDPENPKNPDPENPDPEGPENPENPDDPNNPDPTNPENPDEPGTTDPVDPEPSDPENPDPTEPETPETPEIPEVPETPDTPEIPDAPDSPDTPESPEAPEAPEVPEVPETPEMPEAPSDSKPAVETPKDPTTVVKNTTITETTASEIAQKPEKTISGAQLAYNWTAGSFKTDEPSSSKNPSTSAEKVAVSIPTLKAESAAENDETRLEASAGSAAFPWWTVALPVSIGGASAFWFLPSRKKKN